MEQPTIRVKVQRYFRHNGMKVRLEEEMDIAEGEAADLIALGYVVRVEDTAKARARYRRRDLEADK